MKSKHQLFQEKGLKDQITGLWKYNRHLYVIVFLWSIIGVILDLGFSVMGFFIVGIQYEKNPVVVNHWNNGTFISDLLPRVIVNELLLACIICAFYIIEDLQYFTDTYKIIRHFTMFLSVILAIPVILHYLQGFYWCTFMIFPENFDSPSIILLLVGMVFACGLYYLLCYFIPRKSVNPFPSLEKTKSSG